nr:MAG TPA: hypothetical protein [Caudoviricetes sp.]
MACGEILTGQGTIPFGVASNYPICRVAPCFLELSM